MVRRYGPQRMMMLVRCAELARVDGFALVSRHNFGAMDSAPVIQQDAALGLLQAEIPGWAARVVDGGVRVVRKGVGE